MMKIYFKNPKTKHVKERVCDESNKALTIKEESYLGYTEVIKTYGETVKEFSTEWLRQRLEQAEATNDKELALECLCDAIAMYIQHISKNAHRKGCGTSEKKAASSAANGTKGGRPKGSKNKPKGE